LDRAFYAPRPAPLKGPERQAPDQLGAALWERLRVFPQWVDQQEQGQVLELQVLGQRPPRNAAQRAGRAARLKRLLAPPGAADYLRTNARRCRQWLKRLLILRFSPHPSIKRLAARRE
jgi:hypothetical protein